MPKGTPKGKIVSIVCALAKLHNYCIDREVSRNQATTSLPQSTARDVLHSDMNGAIPLETARQHHEGHTQLVPNQLLGAGQHFDDVPRSV